MDSQATSMPVMCEVCGTYFETRRGLSSHARLHLRQLGVTLSESSGAPIELLYQFIQERDGSLPNFRANSSVSLTNPKKTSQQESGTPSVPEDKSSSNKAGASDNNDEVHVCQLCGCWYETRKGLCSHARSHLRQIGVPDSEIKGNPIDLLYQIMEEEDLKPIITNQQESPSSKSSPKPSSKRLSDQSSPSTSPPSKRPKSSEECTCILCGAEFENRKGLACHSRSHLRQIGVTDLLGKSSATDTVQELVSSGMLKAMHPPKSSQAQSHSHTPVPSTSFSPSPAKSPHTSVNWAPKAKKGFRLAVDPLHRKPKPEPVEVEVSSPKESSSSSSSPTQKLPAAAVSSKSLSAVSSTDIQSPPTVLCDFCGQLFDTRKALSCHARAHLRQLGLTWSIKTSPIDLLEEVMMHGKDGKKESAHSGALRKATWTPQGSKRSLDGLHTGESTSNTCTSPIDYSIKEKSYSGKRGPSHTDASCELCGCDFENRKALASHARAHLRQLGVVEWRADGASSPIELLSDMIRKDPVKVAAITQRYRTGDLNIKKSQRRAASPSLSTDSESVPGSSLKPSGQQPEHKDSASSRQSQDHTRPVAAHGNPGLRSPRGVHQTKHAVPKGEENQDTNSQQPQRFGSIPAMLPKPPLTPLVKLVGKMYSLKCRFCEEVFHGPLSVQEQWITHLQKHILSLGYKGKASPPAAPVAAPALVHPVAV
ncbi:hypothetical protein PAMP_020588 [Pampus punctatissimus]